MLNSIVNNFKIACWNIQGFTNDKCQDENFVRSIKMHDCTILLETWLICNVNISGYTTYCLNAQKGKHGRSKAGIVIVMNTKLKQRTKIVESVDSHMVWIKFQKEYLNLDKDLYLCAIYAPPQTSTSCDFITNLWDKLEEGIFKYSKEGYILIAGDLNSRIGRENENVEFYDVSVSDNVPSNNCIPNLRTSKDEVINKSGRELLTLCRHANLVILNGRTLGDFQGNCTSFQYNGTSVIDYCIVDRHLYEYILYFNVNDVTHLSDHALISVSLNNNSMTNVYKVNNSCKYSKFPNSFKWNEANFINALNLDKFQNQVKNICNKNYSKDTTGINNLCSDVSDVIVDVAKVSLLKRKPQCVKGFKPKTARWYSSNLSTLKNEVIHTGRLLSKYPKDPHIRGKFIVKKKAYKQECRKAKRSYMTDVANKLDDAEVKNPQEFWRLLNLLKHPTNNECDLPNMEDFVKLFKNASHVSDENIPLAFKQYIEHDLKVQEKRYVELLDQAITKKELKEAIDKLNKGKACGEDLIMNEMLKASFVTLEKPLLILFNTCLSTGIYPDAWCTGHIVPIYKSGCKMKVNNYRPITISSCLGKTFSSIVNSRICNFLEDKDIISNTQIGFKKGHRTADHILLLKAIIDKYKQKKKHIYTCFVDFKSAFDTVWHKGLEYKLNKSGVSSKIISLIKSMYSKTHSCVKRGQFVSQSFHCKQGTRQGCSLSPTLFKIYINDIQDIFNKDICNPVKLENVSLGCLMYADDVLVMSENAQGLQKALTELNKYCKKWGLIVNTKKTKIMVFNSRRCHNIFTLGNEIIPDTDRVCYLGFLLTPSGKFNSMYKFVYDKACRALYSVRSVFKNIPDLSVGTQLKMFDCMIKPIMLYGSEVWGAFVHKCLKGADSIDYMLRDVTTLLEKLHSKICKSILQVNKYTNNYAVRCEMGRMPLIIDVICRTIKYYVSINERAHTSLAKVALLLHKTYSSPWITFIEVMGRFLEINTDLLNIKNIRTNIVKIKTKLYSICKMKYVQRLSEYSKLNLYCAIKKNCERERYLNDIKNMYHRKSVTELRLSSHKLPIESGRYTKIKREDRLCLLCKMFIGTEEHCVIKCLHPNPTSLRNNYLNAIFLINPNLNKLPRSMLFKYVILFNDRNITKITAKYIYDILHIYKKN